MHGYTNTKQDRFKAFTDYGKSYKKFTGERTKKGKPTEGVFDEARKARAEAVKEKIRSEFDLDKYKLPKPNQHNIRIALLRLGVTVRLDTFQDRMIITGLDGFDHLDDRAMDRLWLVIDEKFGFQPKKEFFYTVIADAARRNSFHPVQEYFDRLKWDGVKRIDTWLIDYAQAKDTPYVRAVSALMLTAGVRRIRHPGCKFDEMPTLISDQGTNKSTALAELAVNPDWFTDDLPLSADSKTVIERLKGRWIVEAAELKGMRGAAVEHLKSFLSRQIDRARMSYDRVISEVKRQCIIVGTTNSAKFLNDVTGNRRYWPVEVGVFDLVKLKADRDQLWAEAAAREAKGESIRLDSSLWAEAAEEQTERTVADPWVEQIENLLGKKMGKILTTDAWVIVGVVGAQQTQAANERLGSAMKACGWVRKKVRYGKESKWAYVRGKLPYTSHKVSDEWSSHVTTTETKSKDADGNADNQIDVTGGKNKPYVHPDKKLETRRA